MSSFYTSVILRGDNILYRGYDNGKPILKKIKYKPYIFIGPSTTPEIAEAMTLDGTRVDRLDFDSVRDAKEFVENYKGVTNFSIHGQSINMCHYTWINDTFSEVQYDATKIKVLFFDIEVASDDGFPYPEQADKPIISIAMKYGSKIIVFGLGDYTPHKENVTYLKCTSEFDLLSKFIRSFCTINPDVMSGWNIETFDIPYLINRCNKIVGEDITKNLSPWRIINTRHVSRGKANGDMDVFEILGVSSLDYIQLYKKFTYTNQESYKLGHIAHVELGKNKIDYSEYENLRGLYKNNHQLFIEYNIQDVDLVQELDDKLKLIELVYAMAYSAKVNYSDTFGVVRLWDIICHNFLIKQSIVITPKENIDQIYYKTSGSVNDLEDGDKEEASFAGGYVKVPQTGLHNWVVSFDLNSLYPHLIMQYNISPETYVGQIPGQIDIDKFLDGEANDWNTDHIKTANRCLFTREKQGFLPALMEYYYNMRTEYKKKMIQCQKQYQETKTFELEKDIAKFNNLQMAFKIMLNSAYGALGNPYFRYYQLAFAECVTLSGQVSIKWIEKDINSYLNKVLKSNNDYVIASDTDSIYLNLSSLVKKVFPNGAETTKIVDFLDKTCKEIFEPYIEESYQKLADYTNAYSQKMKMKRESIADKGIWTAKKRYILNVHDSEGVRYSEPKLKIMGIEAVKSSTPQSCRDSIKNALKIIMTKDNDALIEFIESFKEQFFTLDFEDIAFPRGCNGLHKYKDANSVYRKGTPIHVKGALLYNQFIQKYGLTKKYELINNGEKIKFCYLKHPNKFNIEVFSSPNGIPKELEITQLIDYEMQFKKAFLEPLNGILDKINWTAEKNNQATIEDFFS